MIEVLACQIYLESARMRMRSHIHFEKTQVNFAVQSKNALFQKKWPKTLCQYSVHSFTVFTLPRRNHAFLKLAARW